MVKNTIVALCLMGGIAHAQSPGAWTSRAADLPADSHGLIAAGGYLYRIGGTGPSPMTRRYDPATDTWAAMADMPTGGNRIATAVIGGTIYAIGITTGETTSIYAYDIAGNSWTVAAPFPTPRYAVCAGVYDGKILIAGGLNFASLTGQTLVEEFDPASGTFSTLASLPSGTFMAASAVIGTRFYYAGGATTLLYGVAVTTTRAMELDPAKPGYGTWVTVAPMPAGRFGGASFVRNGRLYAAGGGAWAGDIVWTAASETYEYDPDANAWTARAPLPDPARVFPAGAALDGRCFVYGGTAALSTLTEFVPGPAPSTPTLLTQRQVGGAPLEEGAVVPSGSSMAFQATISDPTNSELIRLEVELTSAGAPMTAFSDLGAQGLHSVIVPGLANGNWTWRCRAIDEFGDAGPWLAFDDGNPATPSSPDFILGAAAPPPSGPPPSGGSGGGSSGGGCSASAARSGGVPLCLAVLAVISCAWRVGRGLR